MTGVELGGYGDSKRKGKDKGKGMSVSDTKAEAKAEVKARTAAKKSNMLTGARLPIPKFRPRR